MLLFLQGLCLIQGPDGCGSLNRNVQPDSLSQICLELKIHPLIISLALLQSFCVRVLDWSPKPDKVGTKTLFCFCCGCLTVMT